MQLIKFLYKLVGERLTVELKDGSSIEGTLTNITSNMNVTMQQVNWLKPNLNQTIKLDNLNIRGNMIRQIILPDTINVDNLLNDVNQLRSRGQIKDNVNKKRGRDLNSLQNKRLKMGV